jgi:HD-GYP domain-containing protein (c-di-GMP phosphodiesterase class II)
MKASSGPYILGSYRFAYILDGKVLQEARAAAMRAWIALASQAAKGSTPVDVAFGIAACPQSAKDMHSLMAGAHAAADGARALDLEPISVFDGEVPRSASPESEHRARMRAFREAVRGLALAVDARDPYTKDHSRNVSELATALAQVLGMSDADVQLTALAALVHDVGKVGVSDDVLLAGDDLSDADRESLHYHPILGERILQPARVDDVLPLVRHHHERWDGSGYPDGLSGQDIPRGARVLAVCDAFETMTTPRSWRHALSTENALRAVRDDAGSKYDPDVARVFVRMVSGLGSHSSLSERPTVPRES